MRKLTTTVYITPEQDEQLRLLNDKTKVPRAEYIRQGIDLILAQHRMAALIEDLEEDHAPREEP